MVVVLEDELDVGWSVVVVLEEETVLVKGLSVLELVGLTGVASSVVVDVDSVMEKVELSSSVVVAFDSVVVVDRVVEVVDSVVVDEVLDPVVEVVSLVVDVGSLVVDEVLDPVVEVGSLVVDVDSVVELDRSVVVNGSVVEMVVVLGVKVVLKGTSVVSKVEVKMPSSSINSGSVLS